MHQKHDENVGRFDNSSVIWISTGQEIDFSVVQGLPQASELVIEQYLNFVTERLVEREKSIFEPISKSNIKTCNEKMKT